VIDLEKEQSKQDKKKKKKRETIEAKVRTDLNVVEGHENYQYEFLLKRIQDTIKQKQGEQVDTGSGSTLINPKCAKSKTKSMWTNFAEQCEAIDRDPQHILSYFTSELGCEGTIGSEKEMILNGSYQVKNFSKLMRKYLEDYVRCKDCKGTATEL